MVIAFAAMDKSDARRVMSLRLPPDLYERLRAYSDRIERSANWTAVVAIRELLDREERRPEQVTR